MPLIRRLPKFGFTNIFRVEYSVINLNKISEFIQKGKLDSTINPETLSKAGLIPNKNSLVKILGDGDIKSVITITAHKFSKTAADKITASGGSVNHIELKSKPTASTN